jgi:hypothetical protein
MRLRTRRLTMPNIPKSRVRGLESVLMVFSFYRLVEYESEGWDVSAAEARAGIIPPCMYAHFLYA